jgi:cell division protein FtsL
MDLNKRHIFIYASVYATVVAMAIFALILNIKTVSLNQKRELLSKKVMQFEDENRNLQLEIEEKLSLANIENIAHSRLGMFSPTTINYLRK